MRPSFFLRIFPLHRKRILLDSATSLEELTHSLAEQAVANRYDSEGSLSDNDESKVSHADNNTKATSNTVVLERDELEEELMALRNRRSAFSDDSHLLREEASLFVDGTPWKKRIQKVEQKRRSSWATGGTW